jgi:hypothetical protein
MKKLLTISILAAMVAAGSVIKAQDRPPEYLGLPGDNLNLYAVMKLFRDSKTLEDFERDLNDKKAGINNLDLNGDRKIDYITVTDNVNGDVHNIVLQDAISKDEVQDVAVFTVQRFSDGGVQIQLTGDEALYGKNYIIEPNYDEQNNSSTPNPGYSGDNTSVYGRNVTIVRTTPVYIAEWPLIRFIFRPGYFGWHSRWYWGYYPSYWSPWEPFYWDYYYGFHYRWYNNYYGYYRLCSFHRFRDWDDVYYHRERHYSPYVNDRIRDGRFKDTYSHPEMRRNGEVAFEKTHRNEVRRSEHGLQPTNRENSSINRPTQERRQNINRSDNRSDNRSNNRVNRGTDKGSLKNKDTNTLNRRSSGSKEVKKDDKKKNDSGSGNRREPVVSYNRSNSSDSHRMTYQGQVSSRSANTGMNNRFAYNQHSTVNNVNSNRTGTNYNMRTVSNQRSVQSSVSGRSQNRQSFTRSSGQSRNSGSSVSRGVSRSSSSGSHSSSGSSRSGGSSKSGSHSGRR